MASDRDPPGPRAVLVKGPDPEQPPRPGAFAPGMVVASTLLIMLAVGCSRAPSWPVALLLVAESVPLLLVALIDLRTGRAPNRIVYPALVLVLLANIARGPAALQDMLLGGGAAFAFLLVVAIAGRGALGLGDVKFGALCGCIVGVSGVVPMVAVTFLLGLVVTAPLLLFRLRRRDDALAFTPFLALGTEALLCFGPTFGWG